MPVFRIQHITKYEYERPVQESVNEIRIFPIQNKEQEILQHELVITGAPSVYVYNDYWGNRTGIFNLLPAHKEMIIDSRLVVRTLGPVVADVNNHPGLNEMGEEIRDNLKLIEFSTAELIQSHEAIEEIITGIYTEGASVASVIERCSDYIFEKFSYTKGITDTETTVDIWKGLAAC